MAQRVARMFEVWAVAWANSTWSRTVTAGSATRGDRSTPWNPGSGATPARPHSVRARSTWDDSDSLRVPAGSPEPAAGFT